MARANLSNIKPGDLLTWKGETHTVVKVGDVGATLRSPSGSEYSYDGLGLSFFHTVEADPS